MTEERVKFEALSDSALRAEIDIKASPDKVYAAWTQQEQFLKWFGPRTGGSLQVDHFDCTVGGRYDVTMLFADGDTAQMIGTYQELDPPRKIVFTWQWKASPELSAETIVTVDLTPIAEGTHLRLTHERFATTEARDNHRQGWVPLMDRLATVLES